MPDVAPSTMDLDSEPYTPSARSPLADTWVYLHLFKERKKHDWIFILEFRFFFFYFNFADMLILAAIFKRLKKRKIRYFLRFLVFVLFLDLGRR
jgi:hypothetical protein